MVFCAKSSTFYRDHHEEGIMEKDVRGVPLGKDFFKYWSELAKNDPERFEREWKETIERKILDSSERNRERLRQTQWCINMEYERASSRLSSSIRAFQMMRVFILTERESVPPKEACILPFKRKS
ncbi:MAG: DUF3135 domain-containing protein [Minisyncoccota bacterium]